MSKKLTASLALVFCSMAAEAEPASLPNSEAKSQVAVVSTPGNNDKKLSEWEIQDPDPKGETAGEHLTLAQKELLAAHTTKIPASYLKLKYYNPKLFAGLKGDPTATYGFMVPILQWDNRVLLTQVGQEYNDFLTNTSLDFAYRQINHNQSAMWGVYGGFDYQKSKKENHFSHLSAGAEFRTERWHTYSNVYVPISKAVNEADFHEWELQPTTDGNGFHHVMQKQGQEKAMLGVDGAVGFTFLPKYNARFYLGGYHYQASDVKSVTGPRATIEIDMYNSVQTGAKQSFLERVTFQGVAQYDNINRDDLYAGITFVFNIGHRKNLTGMQQYMMYQLPRQYGTQVRPNDKAPLKLYNKADGTPLTIAQVTNEAQFDNAVTNNADVIAVQGSITGLDTKTLNAGQDLTGGDYTLGNGITFGLGSSGSLTAGTGQDLIQVTRDNIIENIALNADAGNSVVVNDLSSSIGNVTINNVTANTGIDFLINDGGTDSNLVVTNSTFTMGNVSNKNMLYARLNSGSAEFTFNDNNITFGDGSNNNGIYVSLRPDGGTTSTGTINGINKNTIKMGVGGSNNGIQIEAIPTNATTNIANLTVNEVDGNTINIIGGYGRTSNNGIFIETVSAFTTKANVFVNSVQNNTVTIEDGQQSSGIYFLLSSMTDQDIMSIQNLINNTVNFTAGSQMRGVFVSTGGFAGTLSLKTVYDNKLLSPVGVDNYGFRFAANSNTMIDVDVNRNGLGLFAANTYTTHDISGNGKVIIFPEE